MCASRRPCDRTLGGANSIPGSSSCFEGRSGVLDLVCIFGSRAKVAAHVCSVPERNGTREGPTISRGAFSIMAENRSMNSHSRQYQVQICVPFCTLSADPSATAVKPIAFPILPVKGKAHDCRIRARIAL